IGDLGASAPGQTSPTGTKRPPRVGPNIRANALQQASPNGLLGRSETTVASTSDAQSIIVGFNDAQGFCGAPLGVACTPQTPSGLSGFAFSTDGVWQFGPTFSATGTSTNANIYFARSLNGGSTFSTPISLAAINSMRQDPP